MLRRTIKDLRIGSLCLFGSYKPLLVQWNYHHTLGKPV
jgi:hypothetical protein